ncbi:MAG: hypothetical protein C0594_12520 [Marinilabiliales bacterium]|nr:MAG: hypothetical protein C0594_12520 [Marinilabiliales bacterium]
MNKWYLITIWLIVGISCLRAQNIEFSKDNFEDRAKLRDAMKEIKWGDQYYEMGGLTGYTKALYYYKNANSFNPDNIELNMKMAFCCLKAFHRTEALHYLEHARSLNGDYTPKIAWMKGKAYQFIIEPDSAITEYKRYFTLVKDTASSETVQKIEKKIEECEYIKELIKTPRNVKIENVGSIVNSRFAEYCPLISADESIMIFTSRRNNTTGGEIDPESGDYYEDLYITSRNDDGEWGNPQNMGEPVNTYYHDATVGLSPDGQELLIYNDDEGNGNIYRCELMGSEWSMPEKLNDNINSEHHEPSACFSFDGRTLYFVSDKPGGLGGRDIYFSKKDSEGNWGPAQNLGAPINTAGDEDAVFLHPDGVTLYFSSNGHKTVGGYDIFKASFEEGKWQQPQNIGYPLNTPDEDVFFVLSASGEHGYYASVRDDSYGSLDLYMVTFLKDSTIKEEEPNLTLLTGFIKDEDTQKPVEARIEIIDNEENMVVAVFRSNSKTGKYLVSLPSGKNYGINVSSENYLFHSENVDIKDTTGYQEVRKDIELKRMEVGKSIVLKNIFFDYDKATLKEESFAELEKLRKLLEEFESVQIEVSGHTDSRGNDDYNLKLSQQRATAVVMYLIDHGIDGSRLIAKGAGETQPIAPNENPDGSDNPEGRALNRRTEFKIISK